jgi:hypothetical protein
VITRLRKAFGVLAPEQRLAGACAIGLFATMFLPWYTRDTTAVVSGRLQTVQSTLMAWKAFSFVEAAILLVAVGVLVLLFARGERKAFHLPGGDGLVILAGGTWVALLVFYRLIDNKTGATSAFQKVDYGVSWGIFVTLLCGLALAYAGQRLRHAQITEPPLPGGPPTAGAGDRRSRRAAREAAREAQRDTQRAPRPDRRERPPGPPPPTDPPAAATSVAPARPRDPMGRPDIDGGTQLSFDEQE